MRAPGFATFRSPYRRGQLCPHGLTDLTASRPPPRASTARRTESDRSPTGAPRWARHATHPSPTGAGAPTVTGITSPSRKGAPREPRRHAADHRSRRQDPIYDDLRRHPGLPRAAQALSRLRVPGHGRVPAWYLLYVVMSMWAHDFMSTQVFGNINVALVFGLLQFVTTFLLAWLYSRFSTDNARPAGPRARRRVRGHDRRRRRREH